MFGFFKKDKAVEVEVPTQVPAHIGIIMDGNGRWAKKRMQPRVFGHKAGMEALQTVTKAANKLGVKVITVYAFSTENWTRPDQEVKFIMNLPVEFYDNYVPELHANNVKIQMIGETDRLPKQTFEDGTTAFIPADKTVKKSDGSVAGNPAANQDSPAQAPAKKAGAKELPNTGTEQSNASLALALLAAATGGHLFAKKREEEE